MDAFKQHVLGAILDCNTIVLIPYATVVDPNILPSNIETICVEGPVIIISIIRIIIIGNKMSELLFRESV